MGIPAKPIIAHNLRNKITMNFTSIGECARYFGTDFTSITRAVRNNRTDNRYRKEWILKYKEDKRTFVQIRDAVKPHKTRPFDPVAVKNLVTGKVTVYKTEYSLLHNTGMTARELEKRLRQRYQVPKKDLLVIRVVKNEGLFFPQYPEWVLELYRKFKFLTYSFFILTDPKGHKSYWEALEGLANSIPGGNANKIRRSMRAGRDYNGYIIQKVSLEDYALDS